MRAGVAAWVLRFARGDGRLRDISPPALLSLLCAAAFAPLIAVGAGVTGAAAVAGIGVLSSVGGGVLSGVITSALDRLSAHGERRLPSAAQLEEEIARQLGLALAREDASADALRTEIAAVLKEIDAGGTALQAAIEAGSDLIHADLIAAFDLLDTGFGELGFLIKDVARAAAEIQKSLDEQGASVRAMTDQNARLSTDIRLFREALEDSKLRARAGPPGAAGGDRRPRWAGGCPYRGLLPFGQADTQVFYGRERLTAELAVKLAGQLTRGGLLVVTGASGAGKSSLLHAGLMPALAEGRHLDGSGLWPCIALTPTREPLTELATHLAVLAGSAAAVVRDELARNPGRAHLSVRQAVAAEASRCGKERPSRGENVARLVLIVDQFEQIFTLNPGPAAEAERQAFITALHSAATNPAGPCGRPPALVLVAVRGDFCDRCAAYPELADGLRDGPFIVGPMTESDLRRTITGPAKEAGLRVDAALTDTILADLRAAGEQDAVGVLPLLSQAMLLTWKNREGGRLTCRGYDRAGGVSSAVQTSADAVYGAFRPEQRALAREIMRSMTVASRDGRLTRRPVTRADLYAGHPDADRTRVDAVLDAFAGERLIVLNGGTVQMAHDALLTAWPRLRDWLEDDRASWILHGQLADDAAAWRERGDDPSFLYRGTQLATAAQAATRWSANPGRYPALAGTQHDFLRASQRAAARRTRQRRALAAALVFLLIASLAATDRAAMAARNANQQRGAAVSGQLAAQSEQLDATDPVTASQLAAAAWRIAPTAQARESMLEVLTQPCRAVLTRGTPINGVAFSRRDNLLATAGHDIRLWDLVTRRQIGAPIPVSGGANAAVFSPDGAALATADGDGTARLWDVATRRQIGPPMTASANGEVNAVSLSPDGKILATADGDGTARLWDVTTRRQIGPPITDGGGRGDGLTGSQVSGVAFSPSGKILATASLDGTARLWDVATRREIGAPMTDGARLSHLRQVFAVAFSPSGKILATADGDGTARLWGVATRRQIGPPITTVEGAYGVAFSPDGGTLAVAEGDGAARLWDVATRGEILPPLSASAAGHMGRVVFSPDGQMLASVSSDGTARLWDLTSYRQSGPATTAGGIKGAAFSPDRKILAATSYDAVRLWDLATGREFGAPIWAGRGGGPNAAAFSPHGTLLATADGDGTARLWDVASRRQIGAAITVSRSAGVSALAFSPGGTVLATAADDGTARLWDVATRRQIGAAMTATGDGEADALAFSPGGALLATAYGDGTARLWDVATRRQIGAAITATGNAAVYALAFSPGGSILATADADGTARLWDVATRRQIGAAITASGYRAVYALAFSPGGSILATADADGTARLWDVATRRQIGAAFASGIGDMIGVAFSRDGTLLATADADGTAGLWHVGFPRDLLGAVCSIAGGSFTPRQWNTYVQAEPYRAVCP
jgi:WD40 repeat protein/uncharacterized protein YwlG (UPF0340 family)